MPNMRDSSSWYCAGLILIKVNEFSKKMQITIILVQRQQWGKSGSPEWGNGFEKETKPKMSMIVF